MSLLIFNNEMFEFLQFAERDSIIAALLLQGGHSHIVEEGNYVKRVDNEIDVVSFLPKSKYEKVEELEKEHEDVVQQIDQLEKTTIETIWISELIHLKKCITS